MAYTIAQIQNLLRQAGWRENMIAKWSAIVMYESGGNPSATNKVGEYSIGLLQMNMKAHGTTYGTESQLKDGLFNLKQAWKLWNIQGDRAWINSVKKYNNNFQGIAEKARKIYNGDNSTPVIDAPNGNLTVSNIPKPQGFSLDNLSTNDKVMLGAAGFLILYLMI